MPKKSSDVAHRAWNILRLALLWARKGGVFKRRLVMDLRIIPKFMKSLGGGAPAAAIRYGERQLSFDRTPIIHVKMHRPASMRFRIPCINPPADADCDFEFEDNYGCYDGQDDGGVYRIDDGEKVEFLRCGSDVGEEEDFLGEEEEEEEEEEEMVVSCEEESKSIDLKAEEFIARFYEQMKLQRQISCLRYNEVLVRETQVN